MTSEELILSELNEMKMDIKDIRTAIYGNGGPGMQEKIRDNGQRIDLIAKDVSERKDMNVWFKRLVAGALVMALISQFLVYLRIGIMNHDSNAGHEPVRVEQPK
jgi:hypothetical protein